MQQSQKNNTAGLLARAKIGKVTLEERRILGGSILKIMSQFLLQVNIFNTEATHGYESTLEIFRN